MSEYFVVADREVWGELWRWDVIQSESGRTGVVWTVSAYTVTVKVGWHWRLLAVLMRRVRRWDIGR